MKVVLIPFWFPSVNRGFRGFLFSFFLYYLHKNGEFSFQNDCIMNHYCEINVSGFKFHFDPPLWRCFPGNFWKINIKMVYSERILRF